MEINETILSDLLQYAPKEVLVQLALNTTPSELVKLCSISRRMAEICKQHELQERYIKKYPEGWFQGKIHSPGSQRIPDELMEDEAPEDGYVDDYGNWAITDYGYMKYMTKPIDGFKLIVTLNNIYEDYWMKDITIYDIYHNVILRYDDAEDVVLHILEKLDKLYLINDYEEDPETDTAAKATVKFMDQMKKAGVKFLEREVSYDYQRYDSDSESYDM